MNLTHRVVDMFASKDHNSSDARQFSANIESAYRGYQFDTLFLDQGHILTAPPDEGWFLILQPGCKATARFTQGPSTISQGHFMDTDLSQGDLIHMPPGSEAKIECTNALFWRFRIKGGPQDFIYKAGFTLLRFCTNTKGGCNTGSTTFNRHRDWRMMLYSGHDTGVPVPADFKPKIELHVPLINASSSTPHWHPAQSKKDDLPQHELYLMLDHNHFGLQVDHSPSKLMIYPGPIPSLQRSQEFAVAPGDAYSIFTQTGHQLYGGLVIVCAFPAHFDLDNEIPVAP